MTDVELRHLAAMAAIAEEGSFGRAAARLGYTQSTVPPARRLPREIYLHWRAGRTQSPLAARAIEIAVEVAAELADHPARASARDAGLEPLPAMGLSGERPR